MGDNPNYHDYFNVDATGRGVHIQDDAYYLTWPKEITQEYADHHGFLVSQDNATALAGFMAARGHCLFDTGRLNEAYEAYAQAVRLSPDTPRFQKFMADADQMIKIKEHQAKIENQRDMRRMQKYHEAFVRQVEADNRRRMQELFPEYYAYQQYTKPYPGHPNPHQPWTTQQPQHLNTYDPFQPNYTGH